MTQLRHGFAGQVAPIALTRSGMAIDLLAPSAATIRVTDLAEQLSKINRYNGATTGAGYSVAQHSVILAEEVAKHDGAAAALYALLHDGHEFAIGDITEPMAAALAKRIGPMFEVALRQQRNALDRVIHDAFGLDWPVPDAIAGLIDAMHARLVLTELRDCLISQESRLRREAATEGLQPLPRRIVPYTSWITADMQFRQALERYAALAGLRRGAAIASL